MLLGVAIAASLPEAARIIRTCVPLLPGGPTACTVGNPEEECSLTRLAVGNTNRLYCLRRAVTGDRYLVREFGASSALRFDRDAENAVFAQLSEHGLSPALIATFPGGGAGGAGGRIEGWLEGGPVTVEACRSPTVYGKVAEALAELHVFVPAAVNAEGACPLAWGWRAVGAWLPAAIERQRELAGASEGGEGGGDGGAYAERVAALRLSDVRGRLEALRELLEAKEPPRCYCHNDLSNTNLHLEPISGELRLVDFEYGGLNYRGFDLATHLSHWAGGASDGRYQCAVTVCVLCVCVSAGRTCAARPALTRGSGTCFSSRAPTPKNPPLGTGTKSCALERRCSCIPQVLFCQVLLAMSTRRPRARCGTAGGRLRRTW